MTSTTTLTAQSMTALILRYFEGCNAADVDLMTSCFVPDAVHYFPPGTYGGPFRGARAIADRWADAVARLGSVWTVDQVITDPASRRAVIEWSHFKTRQDVLLRGDEWYVFDGPTGLISEIRAYYATPQADDVAVHELAGYDYAGRGYALRPPDEWAARR